ncbi:MAG: hypothetical protein HRU80_14115 [Ignavibacteriales bacterium]|nr:MAG: hypothetical protein HRU80_14115 [Ignavibacteriales bacterium]
MQIISEERFPRIKNYLHRNLGLYYPDDRKQDLERAMISVYIEAGFDNVNDFIDSLKDHEESPETIMLLAKYLTIGETYFFREPKVFNFLRDTVIPGIIAKKKSGRKQLRIWSAGCCTGEEAYSVAILLHETVPDLPSWNVTILGTDINPEFLMKAATATYRAWSFRNEHSEIMKKYFTKNERGEFKVSPSIRSFVQWNTLNLIADQFPSNLNNTDRMDIIFCRNVLIYFSDEGRQKIISKFYDSLNEGGYLILSLTEVAHQPDRRFQQIRGDDVIIFRKGSGDISASASETPGVTSISEYIKKEIPSAVTEEEQLTVTVLKKNAGMYPGIQPQELQQKRPRLLDFYILEQSFLKADFNGVISKTEEHELNSDLLSPYTSEEKERIFIYYSKSLANTGSLAKAKETAAKGADLLPESFRLNYLAGHLLASSGLPREAFTYYTKALFLSPGYPAALFGLASVYRQLGENDEYISQLNKLLKIASNIPSERTIEEMDGINASGLVRLITSILQSQRANEFTR